MRSNRSRATRWAVTALLTAVAVLGLAACGGSDEQGGSDAYGAPAGGDARALGTEPTTEPTSAPAKSTGSASSGNATGTTSAAATGTTTSGSGSATGTLADGRHPVFVKSVTSGAVTFDLVQVYTGDAAQKLAAKDGVEYTDGYYVKNTSKKLRTLPLAPDVTFRADKLMIEPGGSGVAGTVVKAPVGKLKPFFDDARFFWLRVKGGTIVDVELPFTP